MHQNRCHIIVDLLANPLSHNFVVLIRHCFILHLKLAYSGAPAHVEWTVTIRECRICKGTGMICPSISCHSYNVTITVFG